MKIINVAVVGCGELSQVAQLPALSALWEQFRVTYICDVSPKVLEYCKARTASNPKVTTSAAEACSSDEVDAVVIASNSALHPEQTILALQNNKHVFVEKPVTYNQRDVDAILEAEQKSRATVFVGYMRRYAPAFISAMAEVGDKSKALHARVRSIVGQNSSYVEQSGMFPKRFDDTPESARTEVARKDDDMKEQALREFGVPATDGAKRMLFWLGALGTHDLSAMREALGPPLAVRGTCLRQPIWSAVFDYPGFSVIYESGMISVPFFDAQIEIYTDDKIVHVQFDQPYIKGLPTTMTVQEKIGGINGQVGYRKTFTRQTYEDGYTLELQEWYRCIVSGKRPKTTVQDAREDLDIFKMLMQAGFGSM